MVAYMQWRKGAKVQDNTISGTFRHLRRGSGLWFAFIFILLFSAGYCRAQVAGDVSGPEQMRIGSIEAQGNVTITTAKILSTVRARVGRLFDAASATEDTQRIAALEGVEYAYYNTAVVEGAVKLTFVIVEKNLVRLLAFKGNNRINSGKLAKELAFKQGDYLDLFLIRDGVARMVELYHKGGYAFVEISLDESGLSQGRVVYEIKEGPRVKVRRVEFEGNESIRSKELAKAVKTRTRKYLFWPVYYEEGVISEDVAKLQDVYQKRGFLDARIEVDSGFSEDNKVAYVRFSIEEGPVYTIERIIITGNEFFDSRTLTEGMRLQVGGFYSKQKADFDSRHILSRYQELGFVDAQVRHQRSFMGPGKVVAHFEISQGGRFRIGQVIITGNESTQDKVIRRILDEEDFSPGQWFDAGVARGDGTGELEKTIQRTILTESTFIRATGSQPDRRDAHVSIIEGQTGSVMLGAGVASDSGLIGHLVFDQRNFDITDWPQSFRDLIRGRAFKGAGQRLRIALEPGTVQDMFSISFTEPYLFDKPVSLDVVGSSFERFRESYNEERLKGYFGFEKRYKDKWRRGISFRAETVDVTDLERDAPREIRDVRGENDLFGAKLYIRKDTTDSRFTPSTGYHFNAGYEQVGGDYTFGILSGTQRWYRTLYQDLADRKTILEVKLHGATVLGDAPPFEKFYAGGTGSLRGFDYRGVSTRGLQYNPTTPIVGAEKKDPIGSDWILLANAEVAVPLTEEVISLLFFVDAGTIDSGGARASVGTGLQILIPQWFGPVPMRFELAAPFMKDDEDETRAFSFSVGALF
ncbi:MAG TPA: outer membrane protein assembly factor BamA [Planctomycetes bacterium]|nr:outer membrane protein assembly factor BamA [Planctomycetota bacterium]HIJ71242.1 outer membrane protein assembly factor BamA [Planctomycetota bacterium]